MSTGFLDTKRVCQAELMDDPALALDQYHGALRGLARINWISGTGRMLWGPIARLAHHLGRSRLRVLDVASGGCDVPLALWNHGLPLGLKLDFHCVDLNERAIAFGQQQAQRRGAPFTFECLNAREAKLPGGFDVATCSLFFQHLTDGEAMAVLRAMADSARHLVLVNDVRRGLGSRLLARLGRPLTGSRVVGHDAMTAARGAFTIDEMRRLANQAGLAQARVKRRWPGRFLLEWRAA